jgi:hypothetical protein
VLEHDDVDSNGTLFVPDLVLRIVLYFQVEKLDEEMDDGTPSDFLNVSVKWKEKCYKIKFRLVAKEKRFLGPVRNNHQNRNMRNN